jgi:predicted tellurium resistance membrane protein TerC
MTISLPMTDNNPNRSAAATNIPAIGIAAVALAVLLLLLLSGPLRRFFNENERV